MRHVRQDPDDYFRRWFFDDHFDLIVWYRRDGPLAGFQLCYDKADQEKALTWLHQGGFSHQAIDTGDQSPWTNRSPMLVALKGPFETKRLLAAFQAAEAGLPAELKSLIKRKIKQYGRRNSPLTRLWRAILPAATGAAMCLTAIALIKKFDPFVTAATPTWPTTTPRGL